MASRVRPMRCTIVAIMAAATMACDHAATSSPCPDINPFTDIGLYVSAADARTSAPLFATVIARDGSYQETLTPGPGTPGGPPGAYFGVHGRPGAYTVTVSAPGYAPWQRDSVLIQRSAQCRLASVSFQAALIPTSSQTNGR